MEILFWKAIIAGVKFYSVSFGMTKRNGLNRLDAVPLKSCEPMWRALKSLIDLVFICAQSSVTAKSQILKNNDFQRKIKVRKKTDVFDRVLTQQVTCFWRIRNKHLVTLRLTSRIKNWKKSWYQNIEGAEYVTEPASQTHAHCYWVSGSFICGPHN